MGIARWEGYLQPAAAPLKSPGEAGRYLPAPLEPMPLVGETEIGEKLLLLNRSRQFDGFDLHDDPALDHRAGAESGVDEAVRLHCRPTRTEFEARALWSRL